MDGSNEGLRARAAGGFRPGDEIGPYELLFRAADGGMASVWAARLGGSRGFQQIVALKLLSEELCIQDDARAMFMDEARTAARIIHPNVGQVLDYGEVQGRPYMAMEWIEGESIAKVASAQRALGSRLPLGWVLHVAAAACAGLHAAHEVRDDDGELLHLVHRDVSPQNVMVTFDGFAKVVDFGVAKSRRRMQVTRVGVVKGKTGYFSPEQIQGAEIDRRSDIFSFGILLYLLATNHHPFRGRCGFETIEHIATKAPLPPRDLVPSMPPELERLILRALEKKPEDRFQTAAELQAELERVGLALGRRFGEQQAGALVERLLPGLSNRRRARLMRAVDTLDRASTLPPPPGATRRGTADRVTVRPGAPALPRVLPARLDPARQEPPDSRTPAGTSVSASGTTHRPPARLRFEGLLVLAIVAAGTVLSSLGERSSAQDRVAAASGVAAAVARATPPPPDPAPTNAPAALPLRHREQRATAPRARPGVTKKSTKRAGYRPARI